MEPLTTQQTDWGYWTQDKKTGRWMIWILLLVSDFLPKHLGWINIFAWRILSYLCKQISNPSLQILSERGSWWLWIPPSWPCYNKLSLFCKDKTAVAAARQFLLLSQSDSSPLLSYQTNIKTCCDIKHQPGLAGSESETILGRWGRWY